MNVFITDPDPCVAAGHLADQHLRKMIVEGTQILSTVERILHGDKLADALGLYKATHRNHPVVLAAVASPGYREWIWWWTLHMLNEYRDRFGKVHKTADVFCWVPVRPDVASIDDAPFCGPPDLFDGDVVASYRRLLRQKYAAWATTKRPGPAKWTNTVAPSWALEGA